MPELPEVETIVRGLAAVLPGRQVDHVEVRDPRLRGGVAPDFASRLTARRIERVDRRGKYVLMRLDDGHVWVAHLGMTGRLTLAAPDAAPARHDHVVISFVGGPCVVYNDPRRFGRMAVIEAAQVAAEAGTGVDPMAASFTPEVLIALRRGRRTSIKALLMDQRRIAGLGNIYVNEALFRAGVRPGRRAAGLSRAECVRIVRATRAVLAAAIRGGGSSINDYRDALGQSGWFQLRHRVYDRAGLPCRRCQTAVRMRVIVGRSSFYCPRCQR